MILIFDIFSRKTANLCWLEKTKFAPCFLVRRAYVLFLREHTIKRKNDGLQPKKSHYTFSAVQTQMT